MRSTARPGPESRLSEIVVLVRWLIVVALLLAACAAPVASPDPDTPVTAGPRASQVPPAGAADATLTVQLELVDAPAVQVIDALSRRGEPVRVAGALFVDRDGGVLLCRAIAESFPPQCGGERLEVIGLDLDTVVGLEEANGVRWAEGVELSGTVD
jgi:hypothetical protein